MVLYKQLIIQLINEEIKGFKTFTFEEGHDISYQAGQYLTFALTIHNEEIRRSYSIISAPLLNEPLAIGVKRIENGFFSRQLIDHALPGDELITTGAGGFFTLPENIHSYRQIFFFAAGSGITPVYSLLKTALHLHQHLQIVLIYSNASPSKTIFLIQLQLLQELFAERFQLRFLFSNSPLLTEARLNRELLIALLKKYIKAQSHEVLFYICGPEPYMRMCTYTLQEERIPRENIRHENFIINRIPPPKATPPDKKTHWATISYSGNDYSFKVQYPDSILQAAKKQGISLPYSCETGRCGSCAAKCLAGKVWLSYNEVLTDNDLKNGLTLTCVGHPIGGDVRLEI